MTDEQAAELPATPSVQSLPPPHPARQVSKPTRQAKGGHKRHMRAPVRTVVHAATAKHSLKGE